jgi:hypothetical protein
MFGGPLIESGHFAPAGRLGAMMHWEGGKNFLMTTLVRSLRPLGDITADVFSTYSKRGTIGHRD